MIGGMVTKHEIARLIDHTLLAPTATRDQIRQLCLEAVELGFGAVCVNGVWVLEAARLLAESEVKVCSVVGFPLGASATAAKRAEAEAALSDGAVEIDMVMDLGGFESEDDDRVRADIAAVADTVAARNGLLKVILETALHDDVDIVRACRLAVEGGAQFVKTSTGFGVGGATVDAVRLMRQTVGPEIGVKASGGIRTFENAVAMFEAGANRLGTSQGLAIVGGPET